MAAILDFLIGMILTLSDLHFIRYFLPSFASTGLSVQQKKRKIDFQNDGAHLRFPIATILAILIYFTPILRIKFRISCPRGVEGAVF